MQLTPLDSKPVRALLAVVLGMLAALPAQASEQLVLLPDPTVLLVLLVAFVAVIFPLNRLIFQPLLQVMDAREERIDGRCHTGDSPCHLVEWALGVLLGSLD